MAKKKTGSNEEFQKTYTSDEVAQMTRVSEDTVRRLAENQEIPGAVKVGSQWRFNKDRIHEWINA